MGYLSEIGGANEEKSEKKDKDPTSLHTELGLRAIRSPVFEH